MMAKCYKQACVRIVLDNDSRCVPQEHSRRLMSMQQFGALISGRGVIDEVCRDEGRQP